MLTSTLYRNAIMKYMFDLLQNRFENHRQLIERVTTSLQTQADVEQFCKMAVDLFELGYLRAVDQYKSHLQKLGYDVKIIPQKKE
jgi:hypothetical protein